jgi:hypothetical protein
MNLSAAAPRRKGNRDPDEAVRLPNLNFRAPVIEMTIKQQRQKMPRDQQSSSPHRHIATQSRLN